jgi:hypothetical protein
VSATEGARARNPKTFENNPTPRPHPNQKKALGGEQGPPTLVYEIALSSKTAKKDLLYFRKICKTRCAKLDRSQPASRRKTDKSRGTERKRKSKAHFGFGLREGRPSSVTGPT